MDTPNVRIRMHDVISTNSTESSYEEVKSALENHFSDRRNVLVERARFNRRVQRPGEPVDTFIQDLYKIAADCEYGTLKNEWTICIID